MGLKLKLLYWERFTNGIQQNIAYHVHSSYPLRSAQLVVRTGTVFLGNKLFPFPWIELSLSTQCEAATELRFPSKCTTWFPCNFGFSSFPLCPRPLSTLPSGFLHKPLMYCCWSPLTCKENGAEIEVAFMKTFHQWISRKFCLSSPLLMPTLLCRWVVPPGTVSLLLTNCVDFHELSFLYASGVRLNLNWLFWANARQISMKLLIFFFPPFPLCSPHLSTLPLVSAEALRYCSCTTLTCKVNRSEIEVAFVKKFHEWIPWIHDFHELSFLYARSVRLQVNCDFWASPRPDFRATLPFFAFPSSHSVPDLLAHSLQVF